MRRVLLDLDCVVSDFVGGTCALFGVEWEALKNVWPAGDYGMEFPLARLLGWGRDAGMTDGPTYAGRMWEQINATPGFWRGLPKLPWADELVAAVRKTTDDWWVVTSPSRCPGCIREKEDWLAEHFGLPHDRMIPTKHKYLLAQRGVVLIDDYDANCKEFMYRPEKDGAGDPIRTGGHAITVPAWHNHLHDLVGTEPEFVLGALDSWARGQETPARVPYHGCRG